jgi:hypothetical protein
MPNVPSAPGTLTMLRALQTVILNNALIGGVSPFAALNSADASRFGVARAVFVGAPQDFHDGYLPQCHIIAENESVTLDGAQGRAQDELLARILVVADFSDWWAAEQSIVNLRDAIWPVVLAHTRGGAGAGTGFVALDPADPLPDRRGGFDLMEVAGVWYRIWSCHVLARQVWSAGLTT